MSARFSPIQEQNIEQLLALSSGFYSAMEQIYLALVQQQLTDTDQVAPLLKELERLRDEARQVDSVLVSQLKGVLLPKHLTAAVKARGAIIRRLLELNIRLTENTKRYKAVIQNELANLYRNRNALNGYKTTQKEAGASRGTY